jgi:RNA polymerase sigma factor (sigma-70 family)
LTVLLNVTRNLNRFRRRHSKFLQRLPAPATEPSAEEVAIAELVRIEQQTRASRLLESLSPSDARILELAIVEELPLATIAEVLGISVDAAKKRVSRARQRARELARPNISVATQPEETRS